MGRKLEFSKEKALHTAMESFWAQGYESTSMRDLAHRLGLHLGSVYNALGDKEKVFEAALRLNIEEEILPRLKLLVEDTNPMQALDRHLSHIVDECARPEMAPGCFVVNSLQEITQINERITSLLHDYCRQVEEAYKTCLDNAKKAGQIPADKDTSQYARYLIASTVSMRVMSKLKWPPASVDDIRICVLKAISA